MSRRIHRTPGEVADRERRIAAGLARLVDDEAPKVAANLTPALKRGLLVAVDEGTVFAYDGQREVRKRLMDLWLVSPLPGPTWGKPTALGLAVAAYIRGAPK